MKFLVVLRSMSKSYSFSVTAHHMSYFVKLCGTDALELVDLEPASTAEERIEGAKHRLVEQHELATRLSGTIWVVAED